MIGAAVYLMQTNGLMLLRRKTVFGIALHHTPPLSHPHHLLQRLAGLLIRPCLHLRKSLFHYVLNIFETEVALTARPSPRSLNGRANVIDALGRVRSYRITRKITPSDEFRS